jgi:hypothetical protein
VFPEIPQDLTTLEDDELSNLEEQLFGAIKHVGENRRDPDVVGDLSQAEVVEQLTDAVTKLELIREEIQSRADDAEAYDSEVVRLAAQAGIDDKPADADDTDLDLAAKKAKDEDPETEGDPEPEPEAETASAASRQLRPLPAATRHKPQPGIVDDRGLRVTAHAAGLGAPFEAGTQLNRRDMGIFINEMVKKNRVRPGQRAVIAAARYDYPSDRVLDETDGPTNSQKIQAAIETIRDRARDTALVAAGALCAPLTPIYELPGVETADRPVRGALPSFQAIRGGVTVGAAPGMGTYVGGVGHVTADDNEAGGTYAAKECLTITCPEFNSVEVDSIYHCIEWDNLASRSYPELMSRIDELVRAEQARLADGFLLTRMAAQSTAVTGGALEPGAVWNLFGDIYKLAAGYRSRNRMAEGAPLQVLFPSWVIDLLALDIVRGAWDPFKTRGQVTALLGNANISPTFYLDTSTTATAAQVFPAQAAGPIDEFPTTMEWFLFAPGTFLHLDAGMLELGVVRDSTLNATNDFQVFGETWENVVLVGHEAEVVTTTICPNGEKSGLYDVSGECGT